jgi:2-polyprenyl-3-methyl-5-hydroxy-6-metoxy-1,4-benzoquinol methylase
MKSGAGGTGRFGYVKQALRARRSSANPIVRHGVATATAAYRMARILFDGQYRSVAALKLFKRTNVHQTNADTWLDRYPSIFSACRTYFGDRSEIKILSYGCSTGDEVLTLRRYFPTAHIIGAEINRRSLAICRRRKVDVRIAFVYSERAAIAQRGPFDAIFCMAVLQRTPTAIVEHGIASLKGIYPFEKFDRQIAEFDALLAAGGLLVIRHSQYRLQDASVAWKYAVLDAPQPGAEVGPKFGRDSERLPERESAPPASIFVKTAL